jgi:23S rRNA (uracil1939-C5)-methyltransferase
VTGVELVPDAVARARENADLNGVGNAEFIEANASEFLKSLEPDALPYSAVIIDPPRAGLHPNALKRLLRLLPRRILYISCNPATFARDAGTIVRTGYGMSEVRPVDMFPHTKHIEVVACFRLQQDLRRVSELL